MAKLIGFEALHHVLHIILLPLYCLLASQYLLLESNLTLGLGIMGDHQLCLKGNLSLKLGSCVSHMLLLRETHLRDILAQCKQLSIKSTKLITDLGIVFDVRVVMP